MISFRALLLWLVLFAVPFQGYAAATMSFCAQDLPQTVAIESVQIEPQHGTAHDHVQHQHQHSGVSVDNTTHDHQDHASSDNDGVHKCGTCGACHSVALTGSLDAIPVVVLPPADLIEPFNAVAFLAPRVLDKPPRT